MQTIDDLISAFDMILCDSPVTRPDAMPPALQQLRDRLTTFRGRLLQFRYEAAAATKAESADRDPNVRDGDTRPKSVAASYKDAPDGGFTRSNKDLIARIRALIADLPEADRISFVLPAEPQWIQEYREIISTHGLDSAQAANFLAARADVATFVGAADAIRRAHEGLAKYKAACEADARSDARSAFVGKVGRLAWGLVKFASIASAAGYVGRLAWADLAARYFG